MVQKLKTSLVASHTEIFSKRRKICSLCESAKIEYVKNLRGIYTPIHVRHGF